MNGAQVQATLSLSVPTKRKASTLTLLKVTPLESRGQDVTVILKHFSEAGYEDKKWMKCSQGHMQWRNLELVILNPPVHTITAHLFVIICIILGPQTILISGLTTKILLPPFHFCHMLQLSCSPVLVQFLSNCCCCQKFRFFDFNNKMATHCKGVPKS